MATAYQIKKIHTIKSRLCLDDDLYRDMLMSFGVCSSKNLTYTEALVFTNILEEKCSFYMILLSPQLCIPHFIRYSKLDRTEIFKCAQSPHSSFSFARLSGVKVVKVK